jgi:phosphoglycolate phosphatase
VIGSPGKIRGILFDKDGTLIDYAASWGPINLKAARLAAAGDPDLAARLLTVAGGDAATGHAVADSVLAAGNTAEIAACWVGAGARLDLDALISQLDALFSASATLAVPVTDLSRFFGRLKARGLSLGIASSDNERSIRLMAAHLGFDAMLDFVAGYDSGAGHKPDPAIVHAFCTATGLVPAEVAMVGDNNHDLAMGRAAGVGLTIGVLTGTGTAESLAALADHCLDSIEGIEAVLG